MKLKELMGILPSRFKVCIAKDGKTYTVISFSNLDSILHTRIFEAEAFMENEVSGIDIGMDKDEDGKDVTILIVHINRLSNWRTNDTERTDGGVRP